MKLIWTSGYTREHKFGNQLVGTSHAGKRPSSIELSGAELKAIMIGLKSSDPEVVAKTVHYLSIMATSTSPQS